MELKPKDVRTLMQALGSAIDKENRALETLHREKLLAVSDAIRERQRLLLEFNRLRDRLRKES